MERIFFTKRGSKVTDRLNVDHFKWLSKLGKGGKKERKGKVQLNCSIPSYYVDKRMCGTFQTAQTVFQVFSRSILDTVNRLSSLFLLPATCVWLTYSIFFLSGNRPSVPPLISLPRVETLTLLDSTVSNEWPFLAMKDQPTVSPAIKESLVVVSARWINQYPERSSQLRHYCSWDYNRTHKTDRQTHGVYWSIISSGYKVIDDVPDSLPKVEAKYWNCKIDRYSCQYPGNSRVKKYWNISEESKKP